MIEPNFGYRVRLSEGQICVIGNHTGLQFLGINELGEAMFSITAAPDDDILRGDKYRQKFPIIDGEPVSRINNFIGPESYVPPPKRN